MPCKTSSATGAGWGQLASVFRLGKYNQTRDLGRFLIVPLNDETRIVDMRALAVNISKHQVITSDDGPLTIDGELFFKLSLVQWLPLPRKPSGRRWAKDLTDGKVLPSQRSPLRVHEWPVRS